jgi:hypothetical protein
VFAFLLFRQLSENAPFESAEIRFRSVNDRKRELIGLCGASFVGATQGRLRVDSIKSPMIRWGPRMGRERIVT